MRGWFGLLGIAMMTAALPANAQPVSDLLAIEHDLNDMCRGWSGDDPHTQRVCDLRDRVVQALQRAGYCYGMEGQAGYQMQWHRCTARSVR